MSKQKNIDTRKKGGRLKLESFKKRRHQHKISYNDTEQEIMENQAKQHNSPPSAGCMTHLWK